MKFSRFHTKKSWKTPFDNINFETRKSEIKNPDGSSFFRWKCKCSQELVAGCNGYYCSKIFP